MLHLASTLFYNTSPQTWFVSREARQLVARTGLEAETSAELHLLEGLFVHWCIRHGTMRPQAFRTIFLHFLLVRESVQRRAAAYHFVARRMKGCPHMLVLSRRLNEKVLFPGIDTAVQIVAIKAGVVRLGIAAPPDVTVLREELQDQAAEWKKPTNKQPANHNAAVTLDKLFPQLCDRLKVTRVGLGLLQLQLDAGLSQDAKATLTRIQEDFQLLCRGVEGELEPVLAPPTAARKARKALVVEDNHNERELLAGFLRMSGLDVDTASDGSDALDFLHTRGRPDVVLLDLGLPGTDGPSTVREIRRDPANTGLKIFAVTGYSPDDFDIERGPTGIDRWFQKPLSPNALLDTLTQDLDNSPSCIRSSTGMAPMTRVDRISIRSSKEGTILPGTP
jgi:carbon storage regulator CsrA